MWSSRRKLTNGNETNKIRNEENKILVARGGEQVSYYYIIFLQFSYRFSYYDDMACIVEKDNVT